MTQRTRSDSPTKTCTAEDCHRPLRARGYCSMHYKRNIVGKKHAVTCPTCGEVSMKRDYSRRFCSLLCRDIWRIDQPDDPMYRSTPWSRKQRAIAKLAAAARGSSGSGTIVVGPCGWCGKQFTGCNVRSRFCSPRCKHKLVKANRRAAESGATGSYTWAEVTRKWLTHGRVCAYCLTPTTLDAIEPDHVVPLSRGGSNSIVNIEPCCKPCNSDKRDLLLSEWPDDRARRGLPPLRGTPTPRG